MRNAYEISVAKPECKRPLEIDWRIILKCVSGKSVLGCGLDSCGSGWGSLAGHCEYGKEPSVSTNSGVFLDYLRNYQLFKDCVLWD
jgi:hypothetical protein